MAIAGKAAITLEGDWDSSKQYERLTGVKYNNSLFISRKKPPVGTAPAEGEYWMLAIEDANGYIRSNSLSTSLLDEAAKLSKGTPGAYQYHLSGSSYTGNDLPTSSCASRSCTVYVRNRYCTVVVVYDDIRMWTNYWDGSQWLGWESEALKSDLGNYISKTEKPFGSYTGNGKSTARTITTGGIGKAIIVYKQGSNTFLLITPQGAIAKNVTAISGISSAETYYVDGKLYIASTSILLNENGATYYYQAI